MKGLGFERRLGVGAGVRGWNGGWKSWVVGGGFSICAIWLNGVVSVVLGDEPGVFYRSIVERKGHVGRVGGRGAGHVVGIVGGVWHRVWMFFRGSVVSL